MSVVAYLKDSPEGIEISKQMAKVVEPKPPEPSGKKANDVIGKESKVVPPLSIYEKMVGRPYTVDYFKSEEWEVLDEEHDIEGTKDKIREIEKWVKAEVKRTSLEDTLDSYKSLMERYEKEIGISRNTMKSESLERIFQWVKIQKKQRDLNDKKEKLIDYWNTKS